MLQPIMRMRAAHSVSASALRATSASSTSAASTTPTAASSAHAFRQIHTATAVSTSSSTISSCSTLTIHSSLFAHRLPSRSFAFWGKPSENEAEAAKQEQQQQHTPAAADPAAATSSSSSSTSLSLSSPSSLPTIIDPLPPSLTDPNFKSLTRLILDVLKTGPKTRKQIYHAINTGELLHRPPIPKPVPPPIWGLKQQHSSSAAVTAAAAALEDEQEIPHAYPAGRIRNMSELAKYLKFLRKNGRIWAKPPSSTTKRLGEPELAAIAEIKNLDQSNIGGATGGKSVRSAKSKAAAAAAIKVGPSWYYMSREWADPSFAAKSETSMKLLRPKKVHAPQLDPNTNQPLFQPHMKMATVRKRKVAHEQSVHKEQIKNAVIKYHKKLGLPIKYPKLLVIADPPKRSNQHR